MSQGDNSARKLSSSEELYLTETLATSGIATSIILSGNWVSLVMDVSLRVDANTILTLLGSRCKNSSRRKALSASGVSPASCCK